MHNEKWVQGLGFVAVAAAFFIFGKATKSDLSPAAKSTMRKPASVSPSLAGGHKNLSLGAGSPNAAAAGPAETGQKYDPTVSGADLDSLESYYYQSRSEYLKKVVYRGENPILPKEPLQFATTRPL